MEVLRGRLLIQTKPPYFTWILQEVGSKGLWGFFDALLVRKSFVLCGASSYESDASRIFYISLIEKFQVTLVRLIHEMSKKLII